MLQFNKSTATSAHIVNLNWAFISINETGD